MPPEGYTTVTISDDLEAKLVRLMQNHDRGSFADAIEYAVDETLARERELTAAELVDMLSDRLE
jgi:hypothetical protein